VEPTNAGASGKQTLKWRQQWRF